MKPNQIKIKTKEVISRLKEALYESALSVNFNEFYRATKDVEAINSINPKKQYEIVKRCHRCKRVYIMVGEHRLSLRYSEIVGDNYILPTLTLKVTTI